MFHNVGRKLKLNENKIKIYFVSIFSLETCVQRPPLGPEKCGRYAEGCLKKIIGK
jgi:hypothetical protein